MHRYYVATVNENHRDTLSGTSHALEFYRSDQLADLADLNVHPHTTGALTSGSPAQTSPTFLRSLFRWLFRAIS